MEQVLGPLQESIDHNARKNMVNVTRDCVLEGAVTAFSRQRFNPCAKLDVHFSGESAIDAGGPSREFFRLVLGELARSPLFWGSD